MTLDPKDFEKFGASFQPPPVSDIGKKIRQGAESQILLSKQMAELIKIADKQLKSALILERYTFWIIVLTVILAFDVVQKIAMDFYNVKK